MQKNVLKKCNILILLILLCAQLSAHSGMLSGEKKLLVAKTKWFDIIYPLRCEESAAILFEKADLVYEEVTAQYGLIPSFRMPVVITPAVENFNAFWTSVPYNHIAIYDTGASGAGGLAVFSETLLSTFRHELTHAVTYNMKNGFWRGIDMFFGDCVAPGMFSVTTGMAEGATVTSESAAGEGRLNDEYAKHYVKQAKIEDQFPAYHDVSGSADVLPGGAPYYFNGAFHDWLQKKYGMAAYAEFWYRVVNGKNFTISGAFKKSFGIKLKKAWQLFEEDYEVPALAANPVEAGLVQDFFDPSENEYSQLNNAGSYYTSLTAAGDRLVWLDNYGGRVFSRQAGDEDFTKLFSLRGITGVRLSNDGRFLAVSYLSENAATEKARVKIYDFENGSFYSVKESGLKESALVKSGDSWYLVSQKYFAQHYSIVIQKLLMAGTSGRISGTEKYAEVSFDAEINPFAFTPLADGTFAYLKKDCLSYSLCTSSVEGELLGQYDFADGMVVHSLSFNEKDNNTFYFSYAQKGTLPRLGKVNAAFDEISLSTKDISGGVFEPLYWDGKVVYIGEFFRQSRLLTMQATSLRGSGSEKRRQTNPNFEDFVAQEDKEAAEDEEENLTEDFLMPETTAAPDIYQYSKPYNPFPYLIHGVFIPYTDYQTDYIGPDIVKAANAKSFFLGASYITANPWTAGASDLFTLAAGWDIYGNTFGSSLKINKGTSTSLLNSQTEVKTEFNKEGWKQSGINFGLSSVFGLGNISQIGISNTASAFLGQKKELFYSLSDVATLQFSTIRRAGPGRFENKGFALAVSYGRWYDASITGPSIEYIDESALAAGAMVCIPHILPFESKYGFTYNVPLTLTAKLLPTDSIYGYAYIGKDVEKVFTGKVVFDAKVEAVGFSMDIQKAIPWLTAVYLNDFSVSAGYAATGTAGYATKDGFQTANLGDYFPAIADGRGYYLDSVYIKANLDLTPNIGLLASSAYKTGFYAIYSYTLHSVRKLEEDERYKLSFGLDLNLP